MARPALALLATLWPFAATRAQTNSGALDLLVPIGARATSMGAAFVAEEGSEALWWNPAGLARLTKPQFALDHFATFQITSGDAVSFIVPAGVVGVFGIGARLFNFGETESTSDQNEVIGISTIRSVTVGASFAATFGPRLNGGVSLRLYNFAAPCSGICTDLVVEGVNTGFFDAGIQFRPSPTGPFTFGASFSNLGPNLQVNNKAQADQLPARVHLGLSYRPTSETWDPRLRVRTTAELTTTPAFSSREFRAGGEVGYVSGETTLLVRAGYAHQTSTGSESSLGPSLGLGLANKRVELDFARIFETFSTGLGKPPTYISIRVGL